MLARWYSILVMTLACWLGCGLGFGAAIAEVRTQVVIPESGFYWNPNEPGRGYAIEIQDRSVFLTVYTYTEETAVSAREPLWFSAGGTMTPGGPGVTYRFQSTMFFSEDGQCLGCSFVDPTTSNTNRNIILQFSSPTRATLTISGERIPIQRFWYSPSIDDALLALHGQWTVVTDFDDADSGIMPFDGDLLEIGFSGTVDGEPVAEGFRGGTTVAVTGAYDSPNNFYVIVVAEQSNEFLAYYFEGTDFGTGRFTGLAERFTPGSNLTGLGFPAYGVRISDRTFTENALSAKDANAKKERPARPRSRIEVSADAPKNPGVDVALLNGMVRGLEARLRASF